MPPKFIVLDLDETLVKAEPIAAHEVEQHAHHKDSFIICEGARLHLVRKRKHLDHFIEQLVAIGKVPIVWSAGTERYVKAICEVLFGRQTLQYVLTREHHDFCKRKKDLKFISKHNLVEEFSVKEAILIDDRSDNGSDNPDRILVVKPFEGGDENDDELLRVLAYLKTGEVFASYA
jgi:HAD superfamily phosphatase (TIGR01681 family)